MSTPIYVSQPSSSSCGNPACSVGEQGCGCQPASPSAPLTASSVWQKVRGWVILGVACALSPCCLPLIVSLGLALFAGTPTALWVSHHMGWVYGGFTLLSVVSFGLAWRWLRQPKSVIHLDQIR